MPVQYQVYQQVGGFAVAAEDVSGGEADSIEITVNRSGRQQQISMSRKTVTINMKGLSEAQTQPFIQLARNNARAALRGTVVGQDMTFGALQLRQAYLAKANPSPIAVTLAGQKICEQLELVYESLIYTA